MSRDPDEQSGGRKTVHEIHQGDREGGGTTLSCARAKVDGEVPQASTVWCACFDRFATRRVPVNGDGDHVHVVFRRSSSTTRRCKAGPFRCGEKANERLMSDKTASKREMRSSWANGSEWVIRKCCSMLLLHGEKSERGLQSQTAPGD